jgi:hypothetical protein
MTTAAPFDLTAIKPSKGPQFSPNLYRWMRWQPEFVRNAMKVFRGRVEIRSAKTCLYIGHLGDDGWFNGTKLMAVLCYGTRKERFAYMPQDVRALRLREVKGFWKRYFKIGRCAIDPKHTQYFTGEETRWHEHGSRRDCVWCNRFTQRKKTSFVKVKSVDWVAVSPRGGQ